MYVKPDPHFVSIFKKKNSANLLFDCVLFFSKPNLLLCLFKGIACTFSVYSYIFATHKNITDKTRNDELSRHYLQSSKK